LKYKSKLLTTSLTLHLSKESAPLLDTPHILLGFNVAINGQKHASAVVSGLKVSRDSKDDIVLNV
jgi:hypothetical protein